MDLQILQTEERNNQNIQASRRHTRSRDFNLQQSTVNCVFAHSQAKRSQQTFRIILERQSKATTTTSTKYTKSLDQQPPYAAMHVLSIYILWLYYIHNSILLLAFAYIYLSSKLSGIENCGSINKCCVCVNSMRCTMFT